MDNSSFFKKVYVLITTHNRTNVACACIESLVRNLKYGNLGWIISDDRSEDGHIEALISKFSGLGISDVQVCRTSSKRFGLGASMNNGLNLAFRSSDVVLTTEDDWFLQKELKLEPYVRMFDIDQNIGCIRFGPLMYAKLTRHHRYKIFDKVYSDGGLYTSVFNNQVALRHRRIYQRLGAYKENCPCDVSEQDMIVRYNCGCCLDVLYPNFMKTGTMDDPSLFFIHVGKSTIGHDRYSVPDRFMWIYDEEKNMVLAVKTSEPQTLGVEEEAQKQTGDTELPIVTVVMTTHNRTSVACAVIDSLIKNLKYPKLKWCISDDRSESGHVEALTKQFHLNGIDDVVVTRTNGAKYGLGASLNNGLKYAWNNSDIVLTTEDDWYIEKDLDIINDVRVLLSNPDICMIRYGTLFVDNIKNKPWYVNTSQYNSLFDYVYSRSKNSTKMIFNNPIGLRHKRIYDKIGYYPENVEPDVVERVISDRYNDLTTYGQSSYKVLRPRNLKNNDFCNGYVSHIGQASTVNHAYKVDKRFQSHNDMCCRTISVRQYLSNNVGDFCSNIVVSFLSHIKTSVVPLGSSTSHSLLAIGSILHHAKRGDVIWGAGAMYGDNRSIQTDISVRLVRGPLTRDILLKQKIPCPEIFCDPGILIPYMYLSSRDDVEKEYDIGIIPHVIDYETVKHKFDTHCNVCVVDMNDKPQNIVNLISKCRKTISSSLHGIIISEALGIPCAWVKFSDKILGGEFKFRDYYYGSGRTETDVHCHDWRKRINVDEVIYPKPPTYNIKGLLGSFPYEIEQRLKEDIERWFSMANLHNTRLMDYSPYSIEKTQIPNIDIKSSEYLYTCVLDSVRDKKPFCVVRMGDGESGIMKYHVTGEKPSWLTEKWCRDLGITKCDDESLKKLGGGLIYAAEKVDFLGSSIWGSSHSDELWNVEKYISRDPNLPRCSNWYNLEWMADGCAHNLVITCSFGVLHNSENTEAILRNSLGKDPRFKGVMKPSGHFVLNGNHDEAENFIRDTNYDVYLVSGGPYGKLWMYEMSRKYNKVMLDIGHAMTRCWARPDNL